MKRYLTKRNLTKLFISGGLLLLPAACTAVGSPEQETATIEPAAVTVPPATVTVEATATATVTPLPLPAVAQTNTPLPVPTETTVPRDTPTVRPEPAINLSGSYDYFKPDRVYCGLKVQHEIPEQVAVELACNDMAPWNPQTGHLLQALPLQGNTAVYMTSQFAGDCQLTFEFQAETVLVQQAGSWLDCGFGGGIDASGSYERTDEEPILSCEPAACQPTPYARPEPEISRTVDSPNGEWTAVTETGFFEDLVEEMRLRVIHNQSGTEWLADSFLLNDFGSYFKVPFPAHWSADGRFLYFTHSAYSDACSRPFNSTDMHRLDLQTGEVTTIYADGYWYAFAPDEQKLAYLADDKTVTVYDLNTGAAQSAPMAIQLEPEHVYLTHLMWSADSRALGVVAHLSPCEDPALSRDGIVYIEPDTLAQTTIILEDTLIQNIEAWPAGNQVLLSLYGDQPSAWLNLETGALAPVEP